MMRVGVTVASSPVHGRGLFLEADVPAGTVLWQFEPSVDFRLDAWTASDQQLHFGYINPRRPDDLVVCGDVARFWNFPPAGAAPNCREGSVDDTGEAMIIAARDLRAGEELLIDLASDADAGRKLSTAAAA